MTVDLAVSRTPFAVRVAVLKNKRPSDLEIELSRNRSRVGDLIMGKVGKVLPGMQAAFIDVAEERHAFLYAGDTRDPTPTEPEAEDAESTGEAAPAAEGPDLKRMLSVRRPIQDVLKGGKRQMVQVRKDPIGTKGLRATTFFSLPGPLLVFLPHVDHVGVSRKIGSEEERERLREQLGEIRTPGTGLIARTAALRASQEDLKKEAQRLAALWTGIESKAKDARVGTLLHRERDLPWRMLREYLGEGVGTIFVDSKEDHEELAETVRHLPESIRPAISPYRGVTPLFEHLGLHKDLLDATEPRADLSNGGFLIIEPTEALVSVDVNSGSYIGKGKGSLSDTALAVNLAAVPEIFRQLRLRGLGGLVVLDFIDMEQEQHRHELMDAINLEIEQDRAKNRVLMVSDFGLVEMTRRRTGVSVHHLLSDACPTCHGSGRVAGVLPAAERVWQEVARVVSNSFNPAILVKVSPALARFFVDHMDVFKPLEERHGVQIVLDEETELDRSAFKIEEG